jgi:hypothetical protein
MISAGSASIGGALSTFVSNSGSTLNGNALLSFGVTHDVVIQGAADIELLNDSDIDAPLLADQSTGVQLCRSALLISRQMRCSSRLTTGMAG